jgi:hypothetical protein
MPAKVILTVIQGPLERQQFVFEEPTIGIIGRAEDCNPRLPDDADHRQIGRHHCLLDVNPPDLRIRDRQPQRHLPQRQTHRQETGRWRRRRIPGARRQGRRPDPRRYDRVRGARAGPGPLRRLREVEMTRALRHPNVVRLHGSGCWEGAFFLTLEYCDGGSVARLVKEQGGRLPVDVACGILLQALAGLEHAHGVELNVNSRTAAGRRRAVWCIATSSRRTCFCPARDRVGWSRSATAVWQRRSTWRA